jgi:ATP-dependent RNA helicase DeaD
LSEKTLKALVDLGFETPSEIQQEAIPHLLENDGDIIALAQTGTGKTAAFGLPLIEKIDTDLDYTQALILAPTRELVQQILQQLNLYSKYHKKLNNLAVYGGASIMGQMKDLKSKPRHIIAATPGRLIDLVKRKKINLEDINYVILDEADEMLNMGFKEEIDEILKYANEEKETWLFSATMAKEIKKIVNAYMNDPHEIKINATNKVNVNITHQYITVKRSNKPEALMRFLDMNGDMRSVVFCKTRRDTQELAEQLLSKGYKADAIHGDLNQNQRDRVMGRFKDHQLELLIATDVAARGIDVDDLSHVIHFALPDDKAYYTHRAGRTARAGKKGISLVFVSGKEQYKVKNIEKMLGIDFQKIEIPSAEDIATIRMKKWSQKILDLDMGKGVDDDLFNVAREVLDGLTKEELIARLMIQEMNKLNVDSGRELNDDDTESRRGGYGSRNRGPRGRGGRGRDRRRGNGGRDHRGGGNRRRDRRDGDRRDRREGGDDKKGWIDRREGNNKKWDDDSKSSKDKDDRRTFSARKSSGDDGGKKKKERSSRGKSDSYSKSNKSKTVGKRRSSKPGNFKKRKKK